MNRTTIFRTNHSQTVHLPEAVAFPDSVREVTVLRDGLRRVVVPANAVLDDFFDASGIDLTPRVPFWQPPASDLST